MKGTVNKKNQSSIPNNTQIVEFLVQTPVFQKVEEAQLLKLTQHCKAVTFSKGSVVFRDDDPCLYVYFIYKGCVAEFVDHGCNVDVIVKLRHRYDYIGEMGALIDEPYANTAVALENLVLIKIPKESFIEFIYANHSAVQFIIRQLIDRLTNAAKKMINVMYLDAEGKLAFTMVRLINGGDSSQSISVTQQDLATAAGLARQTAAKILADWRAKGWISTLRGKIFINDLDTLLDIILHSEMQT